MVTVNFNLRSKKSAGETTIMLVVNFQGKRVRISTKERIAVSLWNLENQTVYTTINEAENQEVNKRLEDLKKEVISLLNRADLHLNEIDLKSFKSKVEAFIVQAKNKENQDYFWKLFDAFVAYKKRTTKSFHDYDFALRKHLSATELKHAIPLTFASLQNKEGGFVDHFRYYLVHEAKNKNGLPGLFTNTIWKQFKNLKAFLNWCFDQQLVSSFSLKHLKSYKETIDDIYLTEDELLKLELLPLCGEAKKVRDLFLLSCETGLRFSDFCSIEAQSIKKDHFEVFPKKTRKNERARRVFIPFSARVKRILQTNNQVVPTYPYSKITQFNKLLKELCKQADINELTVYHRFIKGEFVMFEYPKYELVSSHTGRRTFCTLKFLAGMPSHAIMKFSGHTSEPNFLRYLKLDAELAAKKYRDFF